MCSLYRHITLVLQSQLLPPPLIIYHVCIYFIHVSQCVPNIYLDNRSTWERRNSGCPNFHIANSQPFSSRRKVLADVKRRCKLEKPRQVKNIIKCRNQIKLVTDTNFGISSDLYKLQLLIYSIKGGCVGFVSHIQSTNSNIFVSSWGHFLLFVVPETIPGRRCSRRRLPL